MAQGVRRHVRDGSATRFLVKVAGALALIALFLFGGLWFAQSYVKARVDPDPVTIASASVESLREQNKLSAFEASYVAVVTSTQKRLGFTAERTIIMPGSVQYQVDLGKLTQRDVVWDAKTKTLGITLPPVTISPPAINLSAIREYGQGGVLGTFTDAGKQLDEVNRVAGQRELTKQALSAQPMKMARDATRRAVAQSFAMPLKAAGIDARVRVRFAGEGANDEVWDMSRSIDDVMNNRL